MKAWRVMGGGRRARTPGLIGPPRAKCDRAPRFAMLAARRGLGFLLSDAASQFDMTSLYAALFILMLLGLAVAELAAWGERHMLRWRHAAG